MKKMILVVLLSCALLMAGPVPAAAAEEEAGADLITGAESNSIMPTAESAPATSGTCGEGLTWTYTAVTDEQGQVTGGTLTISGQGAMADYTAFHGDNASPAPWRSFLSYSSRPVSVTIENGVTNIGNCAFYSCNGLTAVSIPDSVTSIGHSAFENSGLTEISIPGSVTNIELGAFSRCTSLAKATFQSGITQIGSTDRWGSPFSGCSNLTTVIIPNTVTSIGPQVFSDLPKLTNVVIPDGVKTIGREAFAGCTSLNAITIPGSVTTIGLGAFSGCTNLSELTIGNGVSYIGDTQSMGSGGAFRGCTSLTRVSIPASVIRMNIDTFYLCENLTEISVDAGNSQFSSYDGALLDKLQATLLTCPNGKTSYSIPDGVTSIGSYAFASCSKLTDVTIPTSVTQIGSYAFGACSSLTGVTIPTSVTTMGNGVFDSCSSLTSMVIPDSVSDRFSNSFVAMFAGCTSLTSVTLPGSVKGLGGRMFNGCTSLTEVTVPEGVEMLNGTFEGCSNLRSVSLPVSLKSINSNTFANCLNLQSITYAGTETQWGQVLIAEGNPEIGRVTVTCTGTGTPVNPDNPDAPNTPDTLELGVQNGGLGKKISLQIEGGHWLTIQVHRAGSIAISSIRVPGAGLTNITFSAPLGSTVRIWETETEMTFTNGIPNNPILSTCTRQL